jgi:cyanophycinase
MDRATRTTAQTLSILTALTIAGPLPLAPQEIGPGNGALVIVGGALQDSAIRERFIDLAGGTAAPIVVIPTAGGAEEYDQYHRDARAFRDMGVESVTVLHTYDPDVADTEAFVLPIREARGVWFPGGRQWRLADAYLDTRVHDELHAVLARGGVIGGSSAGATIQGSYLARGDTRTNTVMMGDHEEGFGFLRDVAIDQHLIRRNRHFDLLEIIEARPELLGIGIDENTAIVVQGDEFEVMGAGYVAIYDAGSQIDTGGSFYFLSPGDRFNLNTREAFRPATEGRPLDRIEKRPPSGR